MEKSEQEKFLEGLKEEQGAVFEPEVETPVIPEQTQEEPEVQGKNRRERRLYEKLEAERQASAQLAEKLHILSEAQKVRGDDDSEYLSMVDRIYGTDTPETREATELLKTAMKKLQEEAIERAVSTFREEKQKESQAEAEASEQLESIMDDIEERYGVDFTDDHTRTQYLKLLEKMSPKDRDGNITEFADHFAVWEILQSRSSQSESRAKELAARSSVQGGQGASSTLQSDSTERWLRENGIL